MSEAGNYNLQMLLKTGDLDIRAVAQRENKLLLDDYNGKLDRFMLRSPSTMDCLLKLAGTEVDKFALPIITQMKKLLQEIGFDAPTSELDGVINGINNNDANAVARHSIRSLSALDTLSKLVKAAKRPTADVSNGEKTLADALKELDDADANRMLRILVVADSKIMTHTIWSMLNDKYDVSGLTQANRLRDYLVYHVPDLFLLDTEFSDGSGFELVPVIKSFDMHIDTPMIFMTARATAEIIRSVMAVGGRDIITKPINPETLVNKVDKWIYRKASF